MPPAVPSIESILASAVELRSAAERRQFVEQACGGDAELQRRVEELIENHFRAGSFLEAPAPDLSATAAESAREGPGTVIGPYKLLQQLGEGGMGAVFMAEQAHPVQRRVALKIIKPGMDSRQVLARFAAERQALALMDHPHIAKVHDGGTTDTGRPYFVMELVKGVPITRYCDEHRLTPRERLELIVPVCQAVQHAHQKGIIHRDLKPSNVLVALYDGKAVPKVIDFGVAKVTGFKLTDKTLFTEFGQVVGTLEYMSPEQAQLNQLDIDTRSDIYALGVLLYELLTGTTPLERKRLQWTALLEALRLIREEEPPRPSTRLGTTKELPAIAANRGLEPRRLSGLVRGELDWIVMKCLEKDRDRRYESANALAQDIERYLRDEPVQACPPSAWYRYRKFARRNKRALLTAAVAAVAVLLAVGTFGWMARDRLARQRETERGATAALAQAEAFLAEGDKQTGNPARWQGTVGLADAAVLRAEELLAAGEASAELASRVRQARAAVDAARTDSRVLAELHRIALEQTAVNEGKFDRARAVPRYTAVLRGYGVDPVTPAEAAARVRGSRLRESLLAALEDWWRLTTKAAERRQLEGVLQAAEPAPDAFRARWRAAARRGDGPALARMASEPGVQGLPTAAVVNLARDLERLEEWAAAERLLRAWQERYRSDFWLNHELGMVLLDQVPPRTEEAIPYLTAALTLRSESPGVYVNLGYALLAKKDFGGAIREYRAALDIDRNYAQAHFGLGNALVAKKDLGGAILEYRAALAIDPEFAQAHNNLGNVLATRKDLAGAIREFRAALAIDPNNAQAHNNLGTALYDKKDLKGAVREFQAALAIDPNRAPAHFNLGNALYATKDLEEAIREYRAALRIDPNFGPAYIGLGNALYVKKDREGAIREYRAALAMDPGFAPAHFNLGLALRAKKDLAGAIREFRAALAIDPSHAQTHNGLGTALQATKDLEGAIREYRAALRIDPDYARAHNNLGTALRAQKDPEGAIREFRVALRIDPDYADAHYNLGLALLDQGRFTDALASLKTGHQLGTRRAGWHYPSAEWIRKAERHLRLDVQLSKVLSGDGQPADIAERLEMAWLCQRPHKQLDAAAARFFSEAFSAEPKLADDLRAGHRYRYNAACAAARAGCGLSRDAAGLGELERARLRRQALVWLRADLAAWGKRLDGQPDAARGAVRQTMAHWQQDPDFAGVRCPEALAKLPEAERRPWQQLWADVEALRQRAAKAK
jgi:tetratricopeptide (TPR) repeat protein/tRNA A-37 threonylcarbamoyl transferase component Bud32